MAMNIDEYDEYILSAKQIKEGSFEYELLSLLNEIALGLDEIKDAIEDK